jgi:hypothetical protein
VYSSSSWDVVKTFSEHSAAVTSVTFAADSSSLFSASLDRSVKRYAARA